MSTENTGWGAAPGGDWQPPTGQQGGPTPGWHPPAQVPQAPKPGVVPLRPLAFGEILDGAFTTIQRYPVILLGISAIVFAVLTVAEFVIATNIGVYEALARIMPAQGSLGSPAAPISEEVATQALGTFLVFLAIMLPLQMIGNIVITGMITMTTARAVLGESMTIKTVWSGLARRLPALVGLSLLITLVIGAIVAAWYAVLILAIIIENLPLLLVGGIGGLIAMLWFVLQIWVRWAVAPAALLMETRPTPDGATKPIGVGKALGRSWRLVKGKTWRTLGIMLVSLIIAGVVAGILQFAFTQLAAVLNTQTGSAGEAAIGGIGVVSGSVLQVAFVAAVNALVYADLRMRKEGLDIELIAASSSEGAEGSTSGSPWSVR